jgi:hypothetical protein
MAVKIMTDSQMLVLMEEIEADIKVDKNDLSKMTLELPWIYNKYLKRYLAEMRTLGELESDLVKYHGERFKYYKIDYERRMDNKFEIEEMINQEPEYNKLCRDKKKQESYVQYIEKSLDNIKNISYQVKNHIEWLKIKENF